MTILFVCHDTGHTNVLLKSANALLAKDPSKAVKFLIVGESAEIIFNAATNVSHRANVIEITEWLPEATMKDLNVRALTETEKRIVADKLAALNPEYSTVGSSCFSTALVSFQILEILTKQKQQLLAQQQQVSPEQVYVGDYVRVGNFDLLQDTVNNPLWSLLKTEWITHISFLLAMAEEEKSMLDVNKQLHCQVVGSPAIDDMFAMKFDLQIIKNTLNELQVKEEQHLLFISGSKIIEDDLALLEVLYEDLKDQKKIALRMGLHPGTQNLQRHVGIVLHWLTLHSGFPLQIIVPDNLKPKLSCITLESKALLQVNLPGEAIAPSADLIASAQPATIATQGVVLQKTVFCLTQYVDRAYVGALFAKTPKELVAGQKQELVTKKAMGLPIERAVDLIADSMLGRRMGM